jgi:DnaK suppressor protein
MLESRHRELTSQVSGGIRGVRADGADSPAVLDEADGSEIDTRQEIELAVIQMKSEMLRQIASALRRLSAGQYGFCLECEEEISEVRLKAVPFAQRCVECERAREQPKHARQSFQRPIASSVASLLD